MTRSNKPQVPDCKNCNRRHKTLFCNLSNEELDAISENKTANFYKKGQVIFYEGNRCQGLFAVYKGKVKLHKFGDEAKEQIMRFANEGDLLGYRALLANESYHTTATAIEDTIVCCIPKSRFLDVLEHSQELSINTIKLLADNLKSSEETIVNITQKTARERIAESLLILKEKFGFRDDNATIDVELTRREIGQLAGIATETTIRTLSVLNTDGLLELNRKSIKLLDIDALVKIANIND